MTQLYVGNLSAEGDEKSIRLLFGKYGTVREVLMKSGYAFVEFELPISAEEAMRELNGELHPLVQLQDYLLAAGLQFNSVFPYRLQHQFLYSASD